MSINEIIDSSPFSRLNDGVAWYNPLRIHEGILEQSMLEDCDNYSLFIRSITPDFQRANTKWRIDQKISFVENVICGLRLTVFLYRTKEDSSLKILDGLQRITALTNFRNGDFRLFGKYNYMDVSPRSVSRNALIGMKIFEFENDVEACKFYISINEYITHSPEDMLAAYAFLKKAGVD